MRGINCLTLTVVLMLATGSAADNTPWYNTAHLYQVYPLSFKDSNGDGIGDIGGITQKAEYFKTIGVDGIYLSPIYPSPMVDGGYDISNYTDIHPMFGTMHDFRALVRKVKELDLKILVDFVPNHSSDQHPWFIKSINKEDPYTDFYIWTDGIVDPVTGKRSVPNNWISVLGGEVWTWNDRRQQYYYHSFTPQQPDLNYRNPATVQAMEDVMKFWLDEGVDGFRVDAVFWLFECSDVTQNEPVVPGVDPTSYKHLNHTCTMNRPENYELLNRWAELVFNYSLRDKRDRVYLLETVNPVSKEVLAYYGKGNNSLMIPFNFQMFRSNEGTRAPFFKYLIDEYVDAIPPGATPNWLLGSHDWPRMSDRYGPEMVDAINILLATLPGIYVTYYGEEIGMQASYIPPEFIHDPQTNREKREPLRTPLQWDNTQSAGFSSNWSTWLPVNPNYYRQNVAAQLVSNTSHLKVFQAVAQLRKDPVLRRGDLTTLAPNNDTLIVIRSYNGSSFILLINMATEGKEFSSQNLFSRYDLDMDLSVSVVSTNCEKYKVGQTLKKGEISLEMRPKAAILLKSLPSLRSSSSSLTHSTLVLLLPLILFFNCVFK